MNRFPKDHNNKIVIGIMIIFVVLASMAVQGCANRGITDSQRAAVAVKGTLIFSTTLYDDGVDAIGYQLSVIPKDRKEARKPYIQTLKVLEQLRKINNTLATWAEMTAATGQVADPEALEMLNGLRNQLVLGAMPVLISLGVRIYQTYPVKPVGR